ncbi:MAG TPA: hypothetical protein ENN40_09180 [Candidatus Aminicenantes bacterium]|nr:hypothetical protein [Candidatus Aminicenantes bacterium]
MTDRITTVSPFRRQDDPRPPITRIGTGSLGGKASGLTALRQDLEQRFGNADYRGFLVDIPPFTVIATDFFDRFMKQNDLATVVETEPPDDRIAHHFMRGELPVDLTGDLHHLIARTRHPLAVRSSGMLEDAADSPFAGIYATKMIPNNQPDTDARFRSLVEAIKFVYASTFFSAARAYREAVGFSPWDEKMAVMIQDVAGRERNKRHYPIISGVARSFNFYPQGAAKPEEGVVDLALGLGKSIVDGGQTWSYSPAHPRAVPPFGSTSDWLKQTQRKFWAVNMVRPKKVNPLEETEFLIHLELEEADYDNTLKRVASTYDAASDRIQPGVAVQGPRIISFAPILQVGLMPLNDLLRELLKLGEEAAGSPVEMEFALDWKNNSKDPAVFSVLQIRPLALSAEEVEITRAEFNAPNRLLATAGALGNGVIKGIRDIVYLPRESFDFKYSQKIARELADLNRVLLQQQRPFLLMGFGRWGSSDPWLGVPVNWGRISGARAMVESTPAGGHVDLSQGSHFFHNLTNLKIPFFSIRYGRDFLDWEWLDKQEAETETRHIRHLHLDSPLTIKVDGRSRQGVILR